MRQIETLETKECTLTSSGTGRNERCSCCCWCFVVDESQLQQSEREKQRQHWKTLLMGQGIALIAASANACSFSLIYNLNVELPILELFLVYFTLTLLHIRKNWGVAHQTWNQGEGDTEAYISKTKTNTFPFIRTSTQLHTPWWVYGFMSLLDVLANTFTLLSLRYTSLTSTSLLGSLTIPSVMLVSSIFMARIFDARQYFGVALCLLGGIMTVLLDAATAAPVDAAGTMDGAIVTHPTARTENSFLGDALAVAASLLYGLGDCLAEYSIKNFDRVEYLYMIGLFGTILTAFIFPFLEGRKIHNLFVETPWTIQIQVLMGIVVYVAGIVLYYISATLFLVHGDATLLVLSLQTTQIWAILFSIVTEHHLPSPFFLLAVVLVVSGVFQYEMNGTPSDHGDRAEERDVNIEETTAVMTESTTLIQGILSSSHTLIQAC